MTRTTPQFIPTVDTAIFHLRPDYSAISVVADGLVNAACHPSVDRFVEEVVWTDERGVTCRRWNWRQGVRTRIDLQTHRAWFVLERLEPMPLAAAKEAAVTLMEALRQMSPGAELTARLIDRTGSTKIA
jgi:hypothetical protein